MVVRQRKLILWRPYIANRYFDAERAGYAAAIGVFSFVMIMIISMIVNAYFRKKEVDL